MKFDIDGEEIERWPQGMRHKRTRRWCRGKPGAYHDWHEVVWLRFPGWVTYYIEKCIKCGRHGALRVEKLTR